MPRWVGFGIGLAVSALGWGCANYIHLHRVVTCQQCFFPYGLPVMFYSEGGFGSGGGMFWLGLVADLLVVAATGWLLGVIANRLAAAFSGSGDKAR